MRIKRPLWIITFLVLLVAGLPALFWGCRSLSVPNVGDPFDVAEFSDVTVPPDENAYALYRQANNQLKPLAPLVMPLPADERDAALESLSTGNKGNWQAVHPAVKQWLQRNQPALDTWHAGTQRTSALAAPPASVDALKAISSSIIFREFARLALLGSAEAMDEGDHVSAWKWQKAVLDSSRHAAARSTVIGRLVASAIQAMAASSITSWADRPEVDAPLLRQALDDVRHHTVEMPPASDALKAEYLLVANTSRTMFGSNATSLLVQDALGSTELMQQQRSLLWANWLSQIDKPLHERQPIVSTQWHLYDVPPADRTAELPDPRDADDWFRTTPIASRVLKMLVPAVMQFDKALQRERATMALLETSLVLQIHRREHGTFPPSLDDLDASSRDPLPPDPFSAGKPLLYRRTDDAGTTALLWSVGPDGDDDAAATEWDQNQGNGDMLLRLGTAAPTPSDPPTDGNAAPEPEPSPGVPVD